MDEQVTFTRTGFWRGMRQKLPLAVSALVVGGVFGVLARQVGLSLSESSLMSALVFAGASQFVSNGCARTSPASRRARSSRHTI